MKKELKTDLERIAYNCRKATFLIEKREGNNLTAHEQMELKIHQAGCYICRLYEQQSLLINDMLDYLFSHTNSTGVKLQVDYKKKLQKKIIENLNKN